MTGSSGRAGRLCFPGGEPRVTAPRYTRVMRCNRGQEPGYGTHLCEATGLKRDGGISAGSTLFRGLSARENDKRRPGGQERSGPRLDLVRHTTEHGCIQRGQGEKHTGDAKLAARPNAPSQDRRSGVLRSENTGRRTRFAQSMPSRCFWPWDSRLRSISGMGRILHMAGLC